LLEFAATCGRQLDLALLARAFPEVTLRSFLDQGANAAVFETQGSEWRFAHDKLREALRRRIEPARRQLLHRQIGETIEAVYSETERDRMSAQLAFHYAQGQRPERASTYYAQA